MDTRVERSILSMLVAYQNNLVTYELMTSQVVLCLLLQMSSGDDFMHERARNTLESLIMPNFNPFRLLLVN